MQRLRWNAQYQADQVPQARQHLRGGPSAQLRAVLVEGHIPYPVEAVLDAPVPTGKAQQSPGIGISGWEHCLNCIAHIQPVSCPSRPAGALADTPVADAATLPRPSQRCPRSHLALGRPRPTTLAAPASHDAALLEHRPRPSAWPRVLATPLPAREVRLAHQVPSRGKSHLQVSAQGGLILFNWQQILSAACHNLLRLSVGSVRVPDPSVPSRYFFDRRQCGSLPGASYLRQLPQRG